MSTSLVYIYIYTCQDSLIISAQVFCLPDYINERLIENGEMWTVVKAMNFVELWNFN